MPIDIGALFEFLKKRTENKMLNNTSLLNIFRRKVM